MNTKTTETALNPATLQRVVKSLAECMGNAQNAGAALVPFSKACAEAKLPVTPSDEIIESIVGMVGKLKQWDGMPQEKARKSEARNLVRQHKYIPELQTALRSSEHGACSYHDAVKLCRIMGKVGNVAGTILAFNAGRTEKKKTDTVKSLERAVQAHYKTVNGGKNGKDKTVKLSALIAVAEAFGFNAVKA